MIECGFFNSIDGDRKYNAEQMSNPYKRIVSDGVFATAQGNISDDLQVVAYDGLQVKVNRGQGMFDGKWFNSDDEIVLNLQMPDVTYDRIDTVWVVIDYDQRIGQIIVDTGVPAINPKANARTFTEQLKYYRLADIRVKANATVVTQSNIIDQRPSAECGFVSNLLQNSDITGLYSNWQAQFDDWFTNVKETLATSTLISSFTSKYVTTNQDETVIPINIPLYKSVLDILQVYINGMLCFEGTDYTVDGFNNVILTNGVDKGTVVHFVVYKSMDGTGIDEFVADMDGLNDRQTTVENKIDTLETKVDNFETSNTTFKNNINSQITAINTKATTNATNITTLNTEITNLKKAPTALWTGANLMGDGATVTPSKKLSDCKNGWILIWCGYNTTDKIATNTRFNSVVVPKTLLDTIPANYMPFYCDLVHNVYTSGNIEYNAKMVQIYDNKIVGFAGNVATDYGKGFCLKQVIEF